MVSQNVLILSEPGLLPTEGAGQPPHDQVDGDGGQGEAGSHQQVRPGQRGQGGAVIENMFNCLLYDHVLSFEPSPLGLTENDVISSQSPHL